jgi:predicted DNA-binding ArsR family transcriptional regulator
MADRTKVVSEATDLVPVLRSFDSDVKREVFRLLTDGYVAESTVEDEFGEEGLEALEFFDQANLVDSEFRPGDQGMEKAFETYYSSFNINVTAPVDDMAEILRVAVMSKDEFQDLEEEVHTLVGEESDVRLHGVAEKLDMPIIRLKALLKRSPHLEPSGHHIEIIEDPGT